MGYVCSNTRNTRGRDVSWDINLGNGGNIGWNISIEDNAPDAVNWANISSTRPTFNNTTALQLNNFNEPITISASYPSSSNTFLWRKLANAPFTTLDYSLGTESGWVLCNSAGTTAFPFKVMAGQYLAFCLTANKAVTATTVTVTNVTNGLTLDTFSATIV